MKLRGLRAEASRRSWSPRNVFRTESSANRIANAITEGVAVVVPHIASVHTRLHRVQQLGGNRRAYAKEKRDNDEQATAASVLPYFPAFLVALICKP